MAKQRYRFQTTCPQCGNESEIASNTYATPTVNCGNCLMNDVEIVSLNVRPLCTCHNLTADKCPNWNKREYPAIWDTALD